MWKKITLNLLKTIFKVLACYYIGLILYALLMYQNIYMGKSKSLQYMYVDTCVCTFLWVCIDIHIIKTHKIQFVLP